MSDMEEKKLTDEEMVKALEDMIAHTKAAETYGFVQITGKQMNSWLDLIHRLQAENELLKQEKQLAYDTVKGYSLTDIEQKAEIERLTEEIDQRRKMMNRMNCNYATELKKNAELQKQVDELKAENTELYKEHMTLIAGSILQKQNTVKDTAKEILIPLIDCEKQIDPLKTGIRWSILKGFCKKFDVEVE